MVNSIELTNRSTSTLADVQILIDGEYITSFQSIVYDKVEVGKKLRLNNLEIKPNAQKLALLTERIVSSFVVSVVAAGEKIFEKECELEIMAFDQWLGTGIMPQCLASFVMPNLPAINRVVVKAAEIMQSLTGSSSLSGYQSKNPDEVLNQVSAVYQALQSMGIVYRSCPASYEAVGQRIVLPEKVLSEKIGNCIELTILIASVLENIGINPILILMQNHAYLGVWLVEDSYAYSIGDDPAFLEKKCSKGINEIIVFESTSIANNSVGFSQAISLGEGNLSKTKEFNLFLDIHRCRLEGFLPLPVTTNKEGILSIDVAGVEHKEGDATIPHHTRYDLQAAMTGQKQLTRSDIWERKLLDFTLRNTMLNLSLRRRAIQFISFDVDKIEDYLQDGNEFCLYSRPEIAVDFNNEDRLIHTKQYETLKPLITDDIAHNKLHTYQTEAESQSILKNIYRTARTSIEETGANSLFLAIGTLRWYETERSMLPRYAPILMLPVEMVYKKGRYYIRTKEEDITLNVTLIEFIRQNYDIEIKGLDPLPTDEHGVDVSLIFAIIRECLKEQKRWNVEEECILGTFSFSKFLMWNDIHNNKKKLVENPIVDSLIQSKLTWKPAEVQTNLREFDRSSHPSDMALPVAVDSSQMAAVYAAGKGNSFILYGPPGTGKSQTITNLIANALYQGERVLFVAEKMAALEVVQKRLEKINLGPFCLELHSNKVAKKHVLVQLNQALNEVRHIQHPEEFQEKSQQLYAQRQQMLKYMEALHGEGTDGFTLFDCITKYESIPGESMELESLTELSALNPKNQTDYEYKLTGPFDTILRLLGNPSQHPLNGLIINDQTLAHQAELTKLLKECIQLVASFKAASEKLSTDSTLDCQPCIEIAFNIFKTTENISALTDYSTEPYIKKEHEQILRDYVHAKEQMAQLKETLLSSGREEILQQDALSLSMEWHAIEQKWFLPRFFAANSFVKKMRFFAPTLQKSGVSAYLNSLLEYHKTEKRCQEMQPSLRNSLQEFIDIQGMESAMERWVQHLDTMKDWYQWCSYRRELISMGLKEVVAYIETHVCDATQLQPYFFKGFFKKKCQEKIIESGMLSTFEGVIFDEQINLYKKLTEEYQLLCQKELYARLVANVPRVTDNIDNSSEIGLLNRNISNGGRGLSIRDLLDQIPELLPRLCPCMLMSPMSVAQYIDLDQKPFDLVIFDEASQMPTSEAIGAIARGKALIVVGDPKQMPPTSFFSSSNVDEDEADIDDMESILEDCKTLGLPSLQLSWHYRSRHESLIAFSNNEYYDGSLITFPSIDDQQTKVNFVAIDGVYDKGGKRSNKAEAEAIVKEIEKRLRDEKLRKYSIGVVAFSVVQQNLIEDLLTERLESNKELAQFADEMYEPIFVKNLENVQGDERDVILFSIGYGPDKNGNVSMNFGPLNNIGGERRLNVAVSRSRYQMMIFSSLHSSQIDLRRSKSKGVEGLKHFLEYAEHQTLKESATRSTVSNSVIAEKIGEALQERGYNVRLGVGKSRFKVDVAIVDKDNEDSYSFGIMLDGESYRRTQTTRDREIVQPGVLKSLSWKTMRIWSVDWLNNPGRVLERIEKALSATKPIEEAPSSKPLTFNVAEESVEKVETSAKEYTPYTLHRSADKLKEASIAIIQKEQPIVYNLLCKRLAECTGSPRVTPTIQQAVNNYAGLYFLEVRKADQRIFYISEEDEAAFSGYRVNSGRDITDIPLVEIENLLVEILQQQISLGVDNFTLVGAKRLGFTRRGSNVENVFNAALKLLLDAGTVVVKENRIYLA